MPSRLLPNREVEQQLPFTGDNVHDADFASDLLQAESGAHTLPRSWATRSQSTASQTLPGSYTRNPVRSFAHQTSHGFADAPQYSSQGVRERSSQLASYALDSEAYQDRQDRQDRHSFADTDTASGRHVSLLSGYNEGRASPDSAWADTIEEDSEPETPETVIGPGRPRRNFFNPTPHSSAVPSVAVEDTERTPLLPAPRLSRLNSQPKQAVTKSQSSQQPTSSSLSLRFKETLSAGHAHVASVGRSFTNPKNYTSDAIVSRTLGTVQTLSAVFLGLLLNILDALSYGYILFPLGAPVFSQTGPDGISIFFVSCIVSQLCYSLGLSSFKGGVGSEMIEVVPFFHKMAYSIVSRMEGEPPEAIIATTIVSYCLSSVLTGLIFLALGGFKLGNLVSFFPRHILIGCIGGVGFFLFITGIEVSARIEGNLNYDMETLHKLFSADTWYLWSLPLFLAVSIMILQRIVKSPFVLPAFFILIFATFYTVVEGIFRMDLDIVRNAGWIFEKPEAGVQFYRFYSYFSEYQHPQHLRDQESNFLKNSAVSMDQLLLAPFPPCSLFPFLASSTCQSTSPPWAQLSRKTISTSIANS
jgi:SulP family sulfate permease